MEAIIWHQVLSNYQNLHFQPNQHVERLRIRQNMTGTAIRLALSNQFDSGPLVIEQLRVSLDANFNQAVTMTLDHQTTFSIPGHRQVWTDQVPLLIQPKHTIYVKLSAHNERNMLATSAGVFSDKIIYSNSQLNGNFIYGLSSIAIETKQQPVTIGFFGDSLTNQAYFTDQVLTNLYQTAANISGFNAGISGNRLLRSGTGTSKWTPSFGPAGIQRFRNDVISYRPDLIISLIGINDLVHPGTNSPQTELPSAEQMIAGYQQLYNEAMTHNIPIIILTIPPFAGSTNCNLPAWNHEKEALRLQINDWLTTHVPTIDIASFVADQTHPHRLAAKLDSGDHLHFSQASGVRVGDWVTSQLRKQSYLSSILKS